MTGSPNALMPLDIPKPWLDKVLANLGRPKFGESCVEWPGLKRKSRYGTLHYMRNGKPQYILVHRGLYVVTHGPIPKGMYCCHTCDNRHCVNPNHIFLGTSSDNMKDASEKGRLTPQRGDKNANSKLTTEQVRAIRASTKSSNEICGDFGVAASYIRKIRSRRRWAWLD